MDKLTLTREVTRKECPWLNRDLKVGDVVYHYSGHTYGCISPAGLACSMEVSETPFFELPGEALKLKE